jgi:hypothetical protein
VRAKESRKKVQRLIKEIAASENPDVVRRELGHIVETCAEILSPVTSGIEARTFCVRNGRLELIPMVTCPASQPVAAGADEDSSYYWDEQGRVDMTLASAAPDLREVLQLIQGFNWCLDDSPHGQEIKRRALDALAKAEGN